MLTLLLIAEFIVIATVHGVIVQGVGGVECSDASSIYLVETNNTGASILDASCSDGYTTLEIRLDTGVCPNVVKVVKRGVEFNLTPRVVGRGEDYCTLIISTNSLSPLRLGVNESLVIILRDQASILVSRFGKGLSGQTREAGSGTPVNSSVYIPEPENARGSLLHSNKTPGTSPSPVEVAGLVAMLAITLIVAVREYGGVGRGDRGS